MNQRRGAGVHHLPMSMFTNHLPLGPVPRFLSNMQCRFFKSHLYSEGGRHIDSARRNRCLGLGLCSRQDFGFLGFLGFLHLWIWGLRISLFLEAWILRYWYSGILRIWDLWVSTFFGFLDFGKFDMFRFWNLTFFGLRGFCELCDLQFFGSFGF